MTLFANMFLTWTMFFPLICTAVLVHVEDETCLVQTRQQLTKSSGDPGIMEEIDLDSKESEAQIHLSPQDVADIEPQVDNFIHDLQVDNMIAIKPQVDNMIGRNMIGSGPQACPLPSDAKWCQVNHAGGPPFDMAVYTENCMLSKPVCETGHWEGLDLEALGPPGHALDIGGHIGYYSFILANAGWNVTTFEPFARNVELMKATLCRNPHLQRIKLYNVGLGSHPDQCNLLSSSINVGDGWARCGADAKLPIPAAADHPEVLGTYVLRQTFPVHRLDDILIADPPPKVDFVKIDVEGFECKVFEGGKRVLNEYKPRLVKSEVSDINGCQTADYIKMFQSKGYKVAKDQACTMPDTDAESGYVHVAGYRVKDVFACRL